jgi:hypothetical protein
MINVVNEKEASYRVQHQVWNVAWNGMLGMMMVDSNAQDFLLLIDSDRCKFQCNRKALLLEQLSHV